MRKITEVLRLKAAGIVFDIAAGVRAGRTTIFEYLARSEAAGLGWPLPEGVLLAERLHGLRTGVEEQG